MQTLYVQRPFWDYTELMCKVVILGIDRGRYGEKLRRWNIHTEGMMCAVDIFRADKGHKVHIRECFKTRQSVCFALGWVDVGKDKIRNPEIFLSTFQK
jgi:hypothetical protein